MRPIHVVVECPTAAARHQHDPCVSHSTHLCTLSYTKYGLLSPAMYDRSVHTPDLSFAQQQWRLAIAAAAFEVAAEKALEMHAFISHNLCACAGWCSNQACRRQEKQAREQARQDLQRANQAARAKAGAGSRGPMPGHGGRPEEEDSRKMQREELQSERREEGAGSRGPLPDENNRQRQREELQSERREEGAGSRGPLPGHGGRPEEEDSRKMQREELQSERREEGAGSRGPLPDENNRQRQREELQSERREEGAGSRGPLPGHGGRPEEENSRQAKRDELQAERREGGAGERGPWKEDGGRPPTTDEQKCGPPFRGEEHLPEASITSKYKDFIKYWSRFGLSRVCQACGTLTPAKHCRPSGQKQLLSCRTCREDRTKFRLPALPSIPLPLQCLMPIEQHLLAMARISQVVLDKLPSGGPSAQWGRMYAVLMEDPCICDVLQGAVLEEDGTVHVQGVEGLTESPARLECLHAALQQLRTQHRLYQTSPAVQAALDKMSVILQNRAANLTEVHATEMDQEVPLAEIEDVELTYLVPKDLKIPNADLAELRQTRGNAELADDMDVKFFPHLFPDGTGGWKNAYQSFAQYARKRLLGQDGRFEKSTPYIMWLLEMQMKKRLSGNVNVRVGRQQKPMHCKGYQDGSRRVYTALRDIPGTQPYLYAKKGVAMSMYEQLGQPQFFLTLTCHARQPGILSAVIAARLLRQIPSMAPTEPLVLVSKQ